MKILIYINILSDGGAERVAANLANYLSAFHEVHLINSFKTDDEYTLSPNVIHSYLDNNQYKSRLSKNIKRIKLLRKYLVENKIDVLLSFMAEPNFRSCLAVKGLKTRLIVSVRNDPEAEYRGRLGKYTAKHLMKKADGCVFQTEDAKKWFPVNLQQKSKIILNSVNPSFFEGSFYEGERQNIVSCGRLNRQKNYSLLIHAFNKIKDNTKENLIIYGDGPLKDQLQQEIKELGLENRILLAGRINDVPNTIRKAKLFVMSSDFEGMPNSLMEALTLGIPCISTDCPCGGPRTIIKDNENGFLVPVNDENALAEKMLFVLNNQARANEVGKNAYDQARTMFDAEAINNEWREYIESVANSK